MNRVLPKPVANFLQNRLFETGGILLCAVGIFFLLSLVSYHPEDPSWNTYSPLPTQNFLGSLGSYTADIVIQLFGYTGLFLIFLSWAWSWKLFHKQSIRHFLIRLLLVPPALVLFSFFVTSLLVIFKAYVFYEPHSALGAIGTTLFNKLYQYPFFFHMGFSEYLFAGISGILTAATIGYICHLTWAEWKSLFAHAWQYTYKTGHFIITRSYAAIYWLVVKLMSRKADTKKKPVKKKKKTVKNDQEVMPAMLVEQPKNTTKSKRSTKSKADTTEIAPQGMFRLPQLGLLTQKPASKNVKSPNEVNLQEMAQLLERTLKDFGVKGEIVRVRPGPVVTLYELEPAPGTKTSRVVSLADDIARSMSALATRVATIPGKNVIGIELPNENRETVYLREILSSKTYESTVAQLPLALGKNIGGSPIIVDLVRMPHLLIAGTTGSGKSVAVNCMILSLLYSLPPEQCRFIMIDPKMLELSAYDHIPHLLTPVVTDPKEAILALKWAVREMEMRYQAMSKLGVRNIIGYNQRVMQAQAKGEILTKRVQTGYDPETGAPQYEEQTIDSSPLPYIVIIVDEMADLMLIAGKEVEATIQRLAQMARAAGIHLVLATQRPSVDVITGTIKANLPTRISFHVTTKIDSRTILGEQGAEQLLGMGDMLYMATGGRITRIHGPFVGDDEVEKVTDFLRKQAQPAYEEAVTQELDEEPGIPGLDTGSGSSGDDLYDQALQIILRDQKVSTSYIQRRLQIGYNRAATIIEKMEEEGVISKPNKSGKREILLTQA